MGIGGFTVGDSDTLDNRIPVVVNGIRGKLGGPIAKKLLKSEEFVLLPHSLTGSEEKDPFVEIDGTRISLYSSRNRDIWLAKVYGEKPIVIDSTLPAAVNSNLDFYCSVGFNSIIPTTGGDRNALEERVRNSNTSSVIAKNMAKQIVALQEVVGNFAKSNPNLLNDYLLRVVESHQNGKPDPSGTAKDFIDFFNVLGIPYQKKGVEINDIYLLDDLSNSKLIGMIRDPKIQRDIGVREENLKGHGWHEYKFMPTKGANTNLIIPFGEVLGNFLSESNVFDGYSNDFEKSGGTVSVSRLSPDGNVSMGLVYASDGGLTLRHDVNGRSVYVDGVMDALRFMTKARVEKGKVYSMIDVIKSSS